MNRNTLALALLVLASLGCQSLLTDPVNSAVRHARSGPGMPTYAAGENCFQHQACRTQLGQM
ncbi:hypothetical protein SAMN06265795_103177 [Noviherbaspirillum humi]|uniref:Lipoprotein n=1 Tax=Noviherbaspirillum humi TaxID=1688639 RepID=A0A239F678_9BURK|nr:hypothetical protein [Noviherbaspirillum humi]SNS51803.1 hypothetical protein SAMN06265795_103177 [Noviherbaspirillum humi]